LSLNVLAQGTEINWDEQLSNATSYTQKLALLNDIAIAFPKSISPDIKEKLSSITATLILQLKYKDLCKKIGDLMEDGLISQKQLIFIIEDLVSTAKFLAEDRSEFNDLLTKAKFLSDNIDDQPQKEKTLTNINEAVDLKLKDDQKALEKRIREYFNGSISELKTYENCVEIMVYNIFSMQGSMSTLHYDYDKELLSLIILGTPKENGEDGLWARIKDVPYLPEGTADMVQLVFLCGNDKVLYRGKEYEPSKLLASLFNKKLIPYNEQFLNAVKNVKGLRPDYTIEISRRVFPVSELIPDNGAFEKIAKMTFYYLE
jgi:hypothetical protein